MGLKEFFYFRTLLVIGSAFLLSEALYEERCAKPEAPKNAYSICECCDEEEKQKLFEEFKDLTSINEECSDTHSSNNNLDIPCVKNKIDFSDSEEAEDEIEVRYIEESEEDEYESEDSGSEDEIPQKSHKRRKRLRIGSDSELDSQTETEKRQKDIALDGTERDGTTRCAFCSATCKEYYVLKGTENEKRITLECKNGEWVRLEEGNVGNDGKMPDCVFGGRLCKPRKLPIQRNILCQIFCGRRRQDCVTFKKDSCLINCVKKLEKFERKRDPWRKVIEKKRS